MGFYRYILAFGSNLGNRELNCQRGEAHLSKFGHIVRASRHLYTEPLKSADFAIEENQDLFLNYIIEFQTQRSPQDIYTHITCIEDEVGHDRSRKWAPRHLDIDILFASFRPDLSQGWEALCLSEKEGGLEIPHPELAKRSFLMDLLKESFAEFSA